MKKIFTTLILVWATFALFAQVDLKKEIFAFTDTTETILRNGRKLIVDKTLNGDQKAAIQTLNYLKNNVDEKYVILYPNEEVLVSLANRNFQLFLYVARNFNSLLDDKTKAIQFEPILPELHSYLSDEINFIAEELENSTLKKEEKDFIKLYIRYYLNDEKTALNKSIKNYEKANPKTEYSDFLDELKRLTTTGRMNFCLGYGNEFLNGNIAETFDDYLHVINMEFDGFTNNLYLSLFMGGSINKITSTSDLPVKKKDWIHSQQETVSSLKYGLKVGRSVFSNQRINLYPYLTIGGYEMNSQSSEFEDKESSEPKNNLSGAFMTGVGTSCDVILKKWGAKYEYEPVGYLFLRPSIGYDYFLSKKEISKGSDFYFTVSLGIGLGGN